MLSIALGLFIVFIVYVMIWSIKNDGAESIDEQTGFIRMRRPSNSPVQPRKGSALARPKAPGAAQRTKAQPARQQGPGRRGASQAKDPAKKKTL